MLEISVIAYIIITIAVGLLASLKIKNAVDFINAGRNLHPALNTAALFALWYGSETIFGASAEFARHGTRGIIEDPLGGVLCLLLTGLFFARRLYRLNMLTIGDLFRRQYGATTELISSLLMVLSFIGYASAQMVALGILSQILFNISFFQGMMLSSCVVVLYTFIGGMWAVSLTDFVQSTVIIAGLLTISYYVTGMTGNVENVINSISPDHWKFFPENTVTEWVNWISAWLVLGFGSIASQDIFQRVNSARSENAAFYSTLAGAGLYMVFSLLPLYVISAIKIINPGLLEGDLQKALPQIVLETMPVAVQILFFGSLISAIMSTCSGALLAPASLLSENLFKPLLGKKIGDKQFLWLTRTSVLLVGVLSFLLALSSQSIFELVGEASVIGLVTIFIPLVAALFFNHNNTTAALLSMTGGFIVYLVFRFLIITDIEPLVPGFLASFICILLPFGPISGSKRRADS